MISLKMTEDTGQDESRQSGTSEMKNRSTCVLRKEGERIYTLDVLVKTEDVVSADLIIIVAGNAGTEPDEDAAGQGVDDKLVFSVGADELNIPELVAVVPNHLDLRKGNSFFIQSNLIQSHLNGFIFGQGLLFSEGGGASANQDHDGNKARNQFLHVLYLLYPSNMAGLFYRTRILIRSQWAGWK